LIDDMSGSNISLAPPSCESPGGWTAFSVAPGGLTSGVLTSPEDEMKKSYDFSNAVRNPYAKRLKRQLTIRLDEETIGYFQGLSREMSLPYQTLMNMYLRDCAESRMRPHWAVPSAMKRANGVAALARRR
jgi:hypothetical protein